MKKIALFSDGTGNSSANPQKTNVWRAYEALDLAPGSGQVAYYDNGVGTSPFTPLALIGLGFGVGLAGNVRQIYGFLCRTYEPGDDIYGFGFSRGAFTIRVAMAMIACEGIIDRNRVKGDRDLDRLVRAAYRRFRRENFTPSFLSRFGVPLRDLAVRIWCAVTGQEPYDQSKNLSADPAKDEKPLIRFLGVWDTVDAYGLPIDELTRAWDKVIWPLTAKDRDMSTRIARACHALALDEQRQSFEPMLWNEKNAPPGATVDQEHISQVWFAGVHANVGGGYPDDTLAYVPLNWIIEQSERAGLAYLQPLRQRYLQQANPIGPQNDSRSGVGAFYRYSPRRIEDLCNERKPGLANWLKLMAGMSGAETNEVRIAMPKIHHTVFDRVADGADYAPINLPAKYAIVEANGSIASLPMSAPTLQDRETASDAADRRQRQAVVWNKVWMRKVVYVLTVLAAIAFVVYPYAPFFPDTGLTDLADSLFGTLGFVIQSIPALVSKIPGFGFAKAWTDKYATHQYVFLLGVIVIGALLIASMKIAAALTTEMRINWHHLTGKGPKPPGTISPIRRHFAGFLESAFYRDRIVWLRRVVLEGVAVAFFFFLVIAIASRLAFTAADGIGAVCNGADGTSENSLGKPFRFEPMDPCFATGLTLSSNTRYAIEFQISDGWADETLTADTQGWYDVKWVYYLFTPLRRHLLADWYQPVARIGGTLFDRYPLEAKPAPEEPAPRPVKSLRMEFKARRSGPLYLYLNDAVVAIPGLVDLFYGNNRGYACVTVTRLDETPEPTSGDAEAPSCKVS